LPDGRLLATALAVALLQLACPSRHPSATTASDQDLSLVPARLRPCTEAAPCEAACDAGDGSACMFAGRLYEFAGGVAKDPPKALALYERSCGLGYAAGCYNVAVVLENGRGPARDLSRAAALYRRACAAGSSTACAAASRLSSDGGAP
jgi:TPR repeat protein